MFAKFLYVAAFVSAALAQSVHFALPAKGANVAAGQPLTIRLERIGEAPSQEVAVVIGAAACVYGCDGNGLGHVLYNGPFNPEPANGATYQDFNVTAPNWANGAFKLTVAHYYLQDTSNVPKTQFTSTTVNVGGSSG